MSGQHLLYQLGSGLVLVLVLHFCALKLITSNECIAQGAPVFELVHRRKYSERAVVTARHICRKYSQWAIVTPRCNNSLGQIVMSTGNLPTTRLTMMMMMIMMMMMYVLCLLHRRTLQQHHSKLQVCMQFFCRDTYSHQSVLHLYIQNVYVCHTKSHLKLSGTVRMPSR